MLVAGRVGEDGFVVQQISLLVQTHHLAAGAESRVDTHDALLAQWRSEQELFEVLGKYTDGLFVSLLFAGGSQLVLNAGA